MLATPTAGLLPSARLLLLCAIRETGPGAWNEPRKDATRAKFCMWASQDPSIPAEAHSELFKRLTGGLVASGYLPSGDPQTAFQGHL